MGYCEKCFKIRQKEKDEEEGFWWKFWKIYFQAFIIICAIGCLFLVWFDAPETWRTIQRLDRENAVIHSNFIDQMATQEQKKVFYKNKLKIYIEMLRPHYPEEEIERVWNEWTD